MPQKLLTDTEWTQALVDVVEFGRARRKDVVLHTHFNHANEITWITREAIGKLLEKGVFVRNQSVLQRGVNDTTESMKLLVKRLGHIGVHPYYVYVHDLVKGVEDLRTTLQTAIDIEKEVRGSTAGFNTPTFVVDTLGGGGKRDAHSFEYYDRHNGIALFRSPNVDPDRLFYFFDPVETLAPEVQARWADPVERQRMKDEAATNARARLPTR
jgi:lysine 2,3-aminomutase